MKRIECADCRDGEHGNYDDLIELVTVKDPETGKVFKRSYMCLQHRRMYDDDGYRLYIRNTFPLVRRHFMK